MSDRFLRHLTIFGLLALGSGPARAGFIPLAASVGPAGSAVGAGLNGAFYDGRSETYIGSIAKAATIASGRPTATFRSTLVDYPRGATVVIADATPLAAFLGPDAASLVGDGASILDTSVFLFTGFIRITRDLDQVAGGATIDVNFAVGSDDGMRLRIGGVEIARADGVRSFGATGGLASFQGEGLYPIELLYYENHGTTGVEFYGGIPGAPSSRAPAGTLGFVPTSSLFASRGVPEPSSVVLLGLGLAIPAVVGRGRRRGRVTAGRGASGR